ncbi:TetR/AcrR family transcriptional regulator [Baekduia alba]|uniref:TetR/AcrR family transcriptional regulator n=1 Tax=Baekduia alba TaxID=2997333 RepID=UPI0023422DDF|nr:TetR/AcrR family transcriptional regulator [Baekduia alba]
MAQDTRSAVLDAAARLFDTRGYPSVSIADLTAASGVSNGSIYHHFGAKDGVLAALVVAALGDYQRGLLATFAAHADDPHAGLRAAVAFELRWFEANPRPARLVLAHRDAIAASDAGREPLRAANRAFLRGVRAWLDRHEQTKDIDINVVHAVAFAPARELGSLWLAKRVKQRPTTFAPALGDAAWAAINAIDHEAPPTP